MAASRERLMPLVQAINMANSYSGPNGAYALKPTSVQIDHGEFVAIVGTSGSGKSTLMNILGLLDRPTAGRLLFEGRDCGAMSFDGLARLRNRRIGFVFQHYHLLPRMTVVRNVELPLAYAGVPPRERRRRAEAALEAVSLPRKSDRIRRLCPAANSSASPSPAPSSPVPRCCSPTNPPARLTPPRAGR